MGEEKLYFLLLKSVKRKKKPTFGRRAWSHEVLDSAPPPLRFERERMQIVHCASFRLPLSFWKIARLLGKIKKYGKLKIYKIIFSEQKSSSSWEDMSLLAYE